LPDTPASFYTPCMLRALIEETREVLEAYYGRRRGRTPGPAPKGTIPYGLDGRYDEKGRYAIARHLVRNDEARVWDPKNILLKLDVGKWLNDELEAYFAGEWERYAEMNADEDDPVKQRHNAEMAGKHKQAAEAWRKAKAIIKREPDGVVSIKFSPSFREVKRKHGISEETTTVNTGGFVRPLGPMLPPAPLPGYEDADDVMLPPRRRSLDSRPKKKR